MSKEQSVNISSVRNPQTVAFVSICLINAMMNMGKQMSNSILSKYVDSLGAPATIVGLVSSTFALSALIFKLVSGPALDSLNRKHIIIVSMIFLGISFTGYAFAETVPVIVLFRFMQGAAQAFTATCFLTMASEVIPPEKFSTGVGVFALFETVATAIGPSVGLWLMAAVGFQWTFLISAGMMFLSAFVVLFYKYPFTKTKRFRIRLDNVIAGESVQFAVLLFIFNFAFCVVSTYLVIYAETKGVTENIGLYFTIYACTMLVTRPLIGRLTDRFGLVKVLIPALCCFIAAYWMISCASSLWLFLASAVVSAFGLGACQPTVQALCMKCVGVDRRGAASSTCYIANDLGNLLGAPFAGVIVVQFGYVAMWRIMTIPVVIAIVLTLIMRRRIGEVENRFLEESTVTDGK